jgi:hypothetical protein
LQQIGRGGSYLAHVGIIAGTTNPQYLRIE